MKYTYLAASALLAPALACPDHGSRWKRDSGSVEYDYVHPGDWGHLSEEYQLCSIGTQQTPLNLRLRDGASRHHAPTFNYPGPVNGSLANAGTSLSYTFTGSDDNISDLPSFSFREGNDSDEEVYLIGWHIHAPSEHTIDGEPAMAEMHFVHTDADGNPRSVLGFLIQPSSRNSTQSRFFNQLSQPYPALDSEEEQELRINPSLAIQDAAGFERYWSYQGSLTTPPCSEGLRWFVSQDPLYVDNDTLQSILAVTKYSARPVQQRWMHAVNQ